MRKEINFSGKSETAYSLIKSIDEAVSRLKESAGAVPGQTVESKLKEVATAVAETKEALKKAAVQEGLKGAPVEVKPAAPATLNSLDGQVRELKALTEVVKALLEKQEAPVVKTWFEQGEK